MVLHISATASFELQLPSALVRGIQVCVEDVFLQNSWSDKAVSKMLSENKAWGSRDRKIAASIVYTIVRKYLLFNELCLNTLNVSPHDTKAKIDGLILLGTGICYPDKVDPSFHLIFPEIQNEGVDSDQPWLRYSLQPWIYQTIARDWEASAETLISHLDQPAPVYIRRNRLKASQQSFERALKDLGVSFLRCNEAEDAWLIEGPNQLRNSMAFKDGWMEFQDIGSQWIVSKAGINNKMTVVDYCAGKGGKTLHIASLMGNSGKLIASDIDIRRLQQLSKRAERAGVKNLELYETDQLHHQHIQADLVLVDAPCTGSGTFRRQPDLKFRLKKDNLEEILPIQREILMKASSLVQLGGKLVYATCSVFKEEDEQQTAYFLHEMKDSYRLIHQEYITPPQYNSDGFYMAIMERVK